MSGLFAALGLETAVLSRRFRLFALGALAGAVFLLLALGFFVFSAFLGLEIVVAPWQAALCVGGGALAFGAILFAVAIRALNRATNQIEVAVKTNALVRAAPVVARLALRSPRLIAGVAAFVAAVVALLRALSARNNRAEN
ncbi:hypothetical protein [Rhodoblastus sp.]|uniref:hypothetical protein n=1 Tax=Rhodoblastus sp. TaxID=1962975 RepID=UPI003F979A1B